jgi:hypothetical protein
MMRKFRDSQPRPDSWGALAAEFVQARLALFRLEAATARQVAARRFALGLTLLLGFTLGWMLALVGLIGWVAAASPWSWWQVTLVAAGLHFLLALAAVGGLRRSSPPIFPLTRAELVKDQTWLETLKRKS